MNQRVGRWSLLLATLVLAILGQLYFSKRPGFFWDGVVFYAAAAVCLSLLVRGPDEHAAEPVVPVRRRPEEWARLALVTVGILLGALAVFQLMDPQENYWPVFWTWAAAMALVFVAVLPAPREIARGGLATLRGLAGWEALFVAGLLIAAGLLRLWRIDAIPWTLSGDEGNFGRWARQVLTGEVDNMFSTGHLSMPSLYAFFQAAWLKFAGDNVFALRLPWGIVGTLSVLGTYLLVRRLFGRGLALVVAILLAGYSYHVHYSRLGLNNIADPFFVVWALYFLVLGWQGGRRWAWMASGLLGGLAFYFYTGGRQVPVILVGLLVWIALTERDFLRRHKTALIAMLIGFLVAVGPMALYAFQHPNDFNARINQVGIVQSGWLDTVAQMENKTKFLVLLEQFRRVFFAFNHFPDNTDFYKPGAPLLDFPMAILFLLGVVLSVTRLVDRGVSAARAHLARGEPAGRVDRPAWRYALFVIWFFGVIITGGVLTDSAPSSQRILSSSIPAIFFVGVTLWELVRAFASLTGLPRVGRCGVALAAAAVLTIGSARFYFGPYQDSWIYGSLNGEVSTAIGHTLADLGTDWKQYFFGAPRMWAEFGSATFISKSPFLDVVEPLNAPPTFVDPQYDAAFIFLPERMGDLPWVQQAYPGGELRAVHRVNQPDGPLLFTAYLVRTKSAG